jgi:hypothetical protein
MEKRDFDGSNAASAAKTLFRSLLVALARFVGGAVAAIAWVASTVRRAWRWGVTGASRSLSAVGSYRDDPRVERALTGLRNGLVGRRLDVSLGVVLVASILAVAANVWAVGVGYSRFESWVFGTWYGTDPRLAVFFAVGGLFLLATVSGAVNSGLVPTTALVGGPVFGALFARYGTTTDAYGVVGIPNAVAIGLTVSVLVAVPVAATGLCLGSVARRTATAIRGRTSGATPSAEDD